MENITPEKRDFEKIDELAGRSARKLFSLSPNDVLVQISLPLVLILAIATRLMMIGQSMANMNQGPIILDLWKQQLILRVDHALAEWKSAAKLDAFLTFSRVHTRGRWPDDPAFQQLCRKSAELADIETLKLAIYHDALHYHPDTGDPSPAFLRDLYDPQEGGPPPPDLDSIPAELRITPEKRAYALNYIEQRCLQWRDQVMNLQWNMVDHAVAGLPPDSPLAAASPAVLMRKLAAELDKRGYPLLPQIINEYSRTDDNAENSDKQL